jgi:glutamine synthetase
VRFLWIGLEQYYAELGHGQQEISTAHAPAVQAADEQVLARETIRGVAALHGLVASLAPKPFRRSRQRRARALLALDRRSQPLPRPRHAPTTLRRGSLLQRGRARAPAGPVRSHGSELQLLPPDRSAILGGAFTCWGHDNREAPLRVPSVFRGMEEASTSVELKSADASCNPYLAVGGLIAAGLDGLERGLGPPEPVEVDPATMSEERRGAARHPAASGDAGGSPRRAPARPRADGGARPAALEVVPRRPGLGVGRLLRR